MALTCGIDEAGRGPVIGPMILAAVVVDEEGVCKLRELKVRDSKKISPKRRSYLEPLVKEIALEYKTIRISASEIDMMRKKMSLNLAEALKTAELIIGLNEKPERVIVDATDNIAEDYTKRILDCMNKTDPSYKPPHIHSEHKADDKYAEVSAASIIAKVARDREIELLREKHGDFGSGYPSDELTQKFLRRIIGDGELPSFVRRSWSTVDKSRQSMLGDF
ncbi:MAG: ribonuclease HII [Candidatus Altiarchaeota archaeon]